MVVKAIRFGQRNYRKNHTILADVLTKHLTQRTEISIRNIRFNRTLWEINLFHKTATDSSYATNLQSF